jgi:dipeptidyl aminopeptidase/acylaminoacyl peptidase
MASLELEDFYDLSLPQGVAVSPDGERVAFLVQESDPEEDQRRASLFVAPTDGSRRPHRLTRASDAGLPKWSPDGRRLGFVAAREEDVAMKVGRDDEEADESEAEADEEADEADDEEDEAPQNGGEGPKPQLWYFDMDLGGDAVQVTDREEGVRGFDWGPDGERAVVAARDPTDEQQEQLEQRRDDGPIEIERLQHKADGVGWTDDVTTYLFVVDLDTGAAERLDDAYGGGAREPLFGLQPAWGPNGRIAFGSNRTERPDDSGVMDIYSIEPDGSDLRKHTDSTLRTSGYTWSPDGDHLAFAAGNPENWYEPTEVHVLDPDDDESWSVTASLDRTVALFGGPSWLDEETVLAPVGDEGLTRLVAAPADTDDPRRTFAAQGRDRELTAPDADGGTVAAVVSAPGDGVDVYALDADDLDDEDPDSLTRVSALNDELLADVDTPQHRRVTYENADGEEIEAIAYFPADHDPESDDPLPVLASIHGGPMSYDAPEFRFDNTFWTGQGYAVYRPNYRGSTSYGQDFAESLKGIRGDLEADDVVSGLHHLAEEGLVDPERSLVTGFSYGGITTANVVTRFDEFAAAAAEHGIYDFRSTFGTDDNHLWHDWEFGLPWEEPETYAEISSIDDVGEIDTPLLVTAGEEDWRCPPTQAEQLYVSVRKQGVPAKLVIYQDEHHNVGDPDRAIHRLRTLTDWFREHGLDEDPDDDGDDE